MEGSEEVLVPMVQFNCPSSLAPHWLLVHHEYVSELQFSFVHTCLTCDFCQLHVCVGESVCACV